jgi:hypothetical protein
VLLVFSSPLPVNAMGAAVRGRRIFRAKVPVTIAGPSGFVGRCRWVCLRSASAMSSIAIARCTRSSTTWRSRGPIRGTRSTSRPKSAVSNPSCLLSTRSTRSHAAGIIRALRNARSILTTAGCGLLCAQVRLRSLRRRPREPRPSLDDGSCGGGEWRFAERDLWNFPATDHSASAPENLSTLADCSGLVCDKLSEIRGGPPSIIPPKSASRVLPY